MALGQVDIASFRAQLKDYYHKKRIENLSITDRPALALMPKAADWEGDFYKLPITVTSGGGRSADYGTANANASTDNHEAFFLTRKSNYVVKKIDRQTMLAGASNAYSFLKTRTSEINGSITTISNDLEHDLFGDGTGTRGIVEGTYAGGVTVPLANDADAINFTQGMVLTASATAVGAVHGETYTVIAVDENASPATITLSAAPASLAAGDFLFQQGDAANGGSLKKMVGFRGWLKPSSEVATEGTFFQVDRTSDPARLAGVYYDAAAAGDNVKQALINAGARLKIRGGSPDVVLMNPIKVAELSNLVDQNGRYVKHEAFDRADIGFDAFRIYTGAGAVDVVEAPFCPLDEAFMLQKSTWHLCSLGNAPMVLVSGHDLEGSDAIKVDIGYYAELGCGAPGYNARIKLA